MIWNRVQFALSVLGVAALHFAISFIAGFVGGTIGGVSRVVSQILLFPLGLFRGPDDPLLGWLGWGFISLLWGLGICTALRYGGRRRAA